MNKIKLEHINIPETVTQIGWNSFCGCSSLKSITIPNGVKKIDDGVFINCNSLETNTFLNSIRSIGDMAFAGCDSLKAIYVPKKSAEKFQRILPENLKNKVEIVE